MGALNAREMDELVNLVRERADVSRLLASEVRRIVETLQAIARSGEVPTGLTMKS